MVDQIRNTTEELRDPANAAMFLLAQMALNTPHGYISGLMYEDAAPVLDDVWLTVQVAQDTYALIAGRADRDAAEADGFAADRPGDDYWQGRASQHRERAAKARAWIERLS